MPEHSGHEFRSYRRALQIFFTAVTVGGIVYLLASIATTIYARRDVPLRGAPVDWSAHRAEDLLGCQSDVERLFRELHRKTFELEGEATEHGLDLRSAWKRFSDQWQDAWVETGQRCGFLERAAGVSPEYEHLAAVHAELKTLSFKLAAHIEGYITRQAPALEEIRVSLAASRQGLELQKRNQAASPTERP